MITMPAYIVVGINIIGRDTVKKAKAFVLSSNLEIIPIFSKVEMIAYCNGMTG